MLKRKSLLVLGEHRNKHHDEMEDAIRDLLDATNEHHNALLGCPDRHEHNYIAMMHAALRIAEAVRNLYIPEVGGPEDGPDADALYQAEAEEEARRPYPPVSPR